MAMVDGFFETANDDEGLVARAISGELDALEALLRKHERRLFNLCLYMLQIQADAEDATQEVLLKITTALQSFRGQSTFRTWSYRIAVNHVFDRRRSRAEQTVRGFACLAGYLGDAANDDAAIPREASGHPEAALLVEETRRLCTMGMLLCLDRQQRVVFLLGEILEQSDTVGAQVLGLSRADFRKRLSRAREQLTHFLNERCGLVDPRNPCRCARKTAAFIRDGVVDPQRLQFADEHLATVRRRASRLSRGLTLVQEDVFADLRTLFPLATAPALSARLRRTLDGPRLRELLDLVSPIPSSGESHDH